MKAGSKTFLALIGGVVIGAGMVGLAVPRQVPPASAEPLPTHHESATGGGVDIVLCDGVTRMQVPGLTPGQKMPRAQALAVTRELMAQWQRKHPGEHWVMAQNETAAPAASQSAAAPTASKENIGGPGAAEAPKISVQQGDTYASFTARDYRLWKAQTDAFVAEGKRIFHSADAMGGTIGVSCDMCHPDASNTHPETYPKYQVQLQRVALLRDMIDWCIENPVKGPTLAPNDPKLRALEAYILAQRAGTPLAYGKH
jgi:hypothetical protein